MSVALRSFVLACLLIGFGIKAGMMPVHIWLPKAHSAAPSHVSALMSGVMIKMGVFMMIRMFFDVLPQPVLWLGYVVLLVGAVTSVLGILYAHAEHDSKRLLAYSSIENIGIIMLGLGAGLVFVGMHQQALGILALTAALFHTINHAAFKSLLFLSAGSVYIQTHTRDIEKYGGLIKRMPITAIGFLIGAIAISGVPPFNGFASEWLTYMSLFLGIGGQSILTSVAFVVAAGALALTSGLALACFVRLFGITFLARPRSAESAEAKEASGYITFGIITFAVICAVLGLSSGFIVMMLRSVLLHLSAFVGTVPVLAATSDGTVHIDGAAFFNIPLIAVSMSIVLLIGVGITYALSRRQRMRYANVWTTGYHQPLSPRMEITAIGFSRSFITVYHLLFRPQTQREIESVEGIKYFARQSTITLDIIDAFDAYLYRFFHPITEKISSVTKRMQSGDLNLYLFYIFIVLLGLAVWVRSY